jgi:hypothetical protein
MINYNIDLLKEIIKRDNCKIDLDKIDKLNKEVRIDFICNCGNPNNKSFQCLYKFGGAFCKKCTYNNMHKRTSATCMIKYKTDSVLKVKAVRDKAKQTCLERYGSENCASSKEVREKCKKTCLERYGKEYSIQSEEVRNKGKQTFMDKYNVEFIFQSPEIRKKIKETCLERYGYENASQNAEISEKQYRNAFNTKEFTFPCGTIVLYQGYENFLLEKLIREGYTVKDILSHRNDVPEIWYTYQGEKHRYYCDAYIPSLNKIYEVKSLKTYNDGINTIPLKKQACIDAGYNFELYIYDRKGNLIRIE